MLDEGGDRGACAAPKTVPRTVAVLTRRPPAPPPHTPGSDKRCLRETGRQKRIIFARVRCHILLNIDGTGSSVADLMCARARVCVWRDKDKVPWSSMNVGKPNRVCHFGSAACQHRGATVVKTMTFLLASMSLSQSQNAAP